MKNSTLKTQCQDKSLKSDSQEKGLGVSELDILRKAYELLLENSNVFFSELENSFRIERERRESNLLI
jgi:hypothetical protein